MNTSPLFIFRRVSLVAVLVALLQVAGFSRQDSTRYSLILNFYSIGTGTPGDQPLKDYISNYRKKNKLPVLTATRVGGLGREGEYAILLPLKELTAKQKKAFVNCLTKALPTLKEKGEAGGINLTENTAFDASRGRVAPQDITL